MHETWTLPTITADDAVDALRLGRRALIDVRKPEARQRDGRRIAEATWIDPQSLDHRHPLTAADAPVAVFCVHGHEVSHFACALLLVHGRDARLVTGGFEALVAAGAPLSPLLINDA
ncbi:MAG: rhodanese-like domain-containing protein [Pseudomonadota bacterium]